jgi:hypothetical protein
MPMQFRGNIYFDHHVGNSVHDGVPNTPSRRMEIKFPSRIYTKKGKQVELMISLCSLLNVLNSELDSDK